MGRSRYKFYDNRHPYFITLTMARNTLSCHLICYSNYPTNAPVSTIVLQNLYFRSQKLHYSTPICELASQIWSLAERSSILEQQSWVLAAKSVS